MNALLVLALGLLQVSQASFGWWGCPEVDFIHDLNLEKYMGTWYEIIRDSTMPWEYGSCDKAQYTLLEGKEYFQVVNSEVRQGQWESAYAKGYPQPNGSVNVDFFWWSPPGNLKIVDTDYTSYSIAHSCQSFGLFHWSYNWLLKRRQSSGYSDEEEKTIISLGTSPDDVFYTSQKDCPPFKSTQLLVEN